MNVIIQKVYVLTLILHTKSVCEEDRWEEGVVLGDVRLNPEETKTPELCRCVILFSPFHYGATHWSNCIVRLSFISKSSFVMTALPFWRGLLVRHDTDQKPGAVARPIENKTGWLNDASLLEACFVWGMSFFMRFIKKENTHRVKRSQLDRPSWLRQTQTAHVTHCGWQSTIKCWGRDLWCCVTDWCRHLAQHGALSVGGPPGKLSHLSSSSLFWCQGHFGSSLADTHTQHWIRQSSIVTPQQM